MARIMVVEDEPLVAADVEERIHALGHELAPSASSGEEALEHARAQPLDLVLMDIRLRGDMDGVETASRLRRDFHLPVVFLTAFADKQTVQRAVSVEPLGYVMKPFADDEIAHVVEQALRKQRERAQRDERQGWLDVAFRSLSDAVILLDEQSRVVMMNAVAESLARVPMAQAAGRPWTEVLSLVKEADGRGDTVIEHALREGAAVSTAESMLLWAPGSEAGIPVEISAMPVRYGSSAASGVVIVLRDVREQRRLLRELSMSERLMSLSTFASGLAHEINNPLTATMTGLDLAAHETDDLASALASTSPVDAGRALAVVERLRSALRSAGAGAERVERVVKDLSSFSRPGRERRPLAIAGVLQAAIRLVENEIKHRARLVCELASAPLVDANEGQLTRAFVSLLVNAAEAIVEGQADRNMIQVTLRAADDGSCLVTIEDTGHGMTPDVMVRMYEPFFTTKPAGSGVGLGLAIAQNVIAAHGGELSARSELGRGSTFSVRLPASREQPRLVTAPTLAAPSRRMRLLIVDDEPLIGSVLEQRFGESHDVTVVTSARIALEVIAERGNFDVVLSDISMPEIDGITLYEMVQKQYPALAPRFVFMTGGAFTERTERFLASVKGRYVLKPLHMAALERLLLTVAASSAPALAS